MRIGTWNLAGRWSEEHRKTLDREDCDVWLLTEVSEKLSMDGYHLHRSEHTMASNQRWAGILSREALTPAPDPHPASAMARVGDLTVCSSILPWSGSGGAFPWVGVNHAERTKSAVDDLAATLPAVALVWGGDWNHALSGREYAGGVAGRQHILDLVAALEMSVPTEGLPNQIDGLLSIDHIAMTGDLAPGEAFRFRATGPEGRHLSDHDGYVVRFPEPDPPAATSRFMKRSPDSAPTTSDRSGA